MNERMYFVQYIWCMLFSPDQDKFLCPHGEKILLSSNLHINVRVLIRVAVNAMLVSIVMTHIFVPPLHNMATHSTVTYLQTSYGISHYRRQ